MTLERFGIKFKGKDATIVGKDLQPGEGEEPNYAEVLDAARAALA